MNNIVSAMGAYDLLTFVTSKLTQMQQEGNLPPNKLEELPGRLLKITIPEHLPHMSIYSKVVFVNNKPFYKAYSAARDLWYGSTQKALLNFSGKKIDPCAVYVVYYTPYLCDFDNYSIKFIIDALRYHGCIVNDDYTHVQDGARVIVRDKKNPRTEIYVIKDNGSVFKKLKICDQLLEKKYDNSR